MVCVHSTSLTRLFQQEVKPPDNNRCEIRHNSWSVSRLRSCNPSERESLRPLRPISAEIKHCAQSYEETRSGAKWWLGNGSAITVKDPVAHRSLGSGSSWGGDWSSRTHGDKNGADARKQEEMEPRRGQGHGERQRHAPWSLSKWEQEASCQRVLCTNNTTCSPRHLTLNLNVCLFMI